MLFLMLLVVLLFLMLLFYFLKKTRGRQNTIPTRGKIYKIFGIQTKKTIAFFLLKKNEDKIS